ncbi:MAG TPA: hypothetical protein VLS90_21650, partial [Thermodesulfobacteriota bacterium]|nr:hypothetical protein [Thermodesulfobacteriota bacterium]
DDDREKLSWREIDKMRDHSRHVSGGKSYKERTLKSDWAKKQHLKEAEKFFQGKKGTQAYKKAYTSLHEKYGTPAFKEALKKFIAEFGMPDDWGTLILIVDSEKAEWAREAISALKAMAPARSPIEQKGFKGKLKILAMTAKDKDLRKEAEKTLEEI